MKNLSLLIACLLLGFTGFAKDRKAVSESLKGELIEVLKKNEQLHQAFFDYEEQKSKIPKIANQLRNSIEKISDPEIKNLLNFSQEKLKEMTADSSKSENNQRYHLVSMALIHILDSYNLGSSYNAYSCPMVKKKWIQNSKKMAKVHNPYAPEMPHCGSQDSKY